MFIDLRAGTLAALTMACAPDPAPVTPAASDDAWTTCGSDLDCVSAILAKKLVAAPDEAVTLIQRAPSPEEQWLLVNGAIRNNPQRGGVLCAALTDSALRERCKLDTSRPHLYAPPPTRRTEPGRRTAPGPHTSTLVLRLKSASLFANVEPDASSCPAGPTFDSCATALAVRVARDGQAQQAAAACRAISTDAKWRGECAMRAAEGVASRKIPTEVGLVIELCLLSEQWVGRCIDKTHASLASLAPPANAEAEAWQPVLATASVMADSWARQGESIAAVVEDAWWSESVTYAYRRVRRPTGDPLDHLPPVAHPHVRAAAAWLYLLGGTEPNTTLEQELAALQKVLKSRAADSTTEIQTYSNPHPDSGPRKDYWSFDEGKDGTRPAVHYLGRSRRVVAEDETTDLQICLLEAAAQHGLDWTTVLADATSSAEPYVAATARRLQKQLSPPPRGTPAQPRPR